MYDLRLEIDSIWFNRWLKDIEANDLKQWYGENAGVPHFIET